MTNKYDKLQKELLSYGLIKGSVLWTVYCLHHSLEVDTSDYGYDLLELWMKITETGDGTSEWSDFSSFDHFMCTYLVQQ